MDAHKQAVSVPPLVIDPHRVVAAVGAAAAIVLGLGLIRQLLVLIVGGNGSSLGLEIINLDGETNLPAWFSSLLLISGSAACALMAHLSRWTEPRNRKAWIALAVIFALMSADEVIRMHEATMDPIREQFDPQGALTFGWVLWGLPLVAVVAALFLPFLARLERTTALRLCIAGAVYVGGALGMEMVGATVYDSIGYGNIYALCYCLEETGEIVGATLFLRAVLLHVARNKPHFHFTVREGEPVGSAATGIGAGPA